MDRLLREAPTSDDGQRENHGFSEKGLPTTSMVAAAGTLRPKEGAKDYRNSPALQELKAPIRHICNDHNPTSSLGFCEQARRRKPDHGRGDNPANGNAHQQGKSKTWLAGQDGKRSSRRWRETTVEG